MWQLATFKGKLNLNSVITSRLQFARYLSRFKVSYWCICHELCQYFQFCNLDNLLVVNKVEIRNLVYLIMALFSEWCLQLFDIRYWLIWDSEDELVCKLRLLVCKFIYAKDFCCGAIMLLDKYCGNGDGGKSVNLSLHRQWIDPLQSAFIGDHSWLVAPRLPLPLITYYNILSLGKKWRWRKKSVF